MLRQNGIAVKMYSEEFDLEINDIVFPVRRLFESIGKDDYLLYFFSIYDRYLTQLLALPSARKLAYFHGITPPRLLQAFDPEGSVVCSKALTQLPELAQFDAIAANSSATAHQLIQAFGDGDRQPEKVKIIAPCLTWARPYPEAARATGSSHARFLFVGQLRPHKRIEHLLELFSEYLKLSPGAECWIVAASSATAYAAYLDWVERSQCRIPPGRVHWTGKVSDEALQKLYCSASVYISMSEHEGFCIPILEAMAAGLPVFSYAQPAIMELLSSSGIVFFEKNFSRLAQYIKTLLDSPDRLAEVVARQHDRAKAVMRDTDGTAFWNLLSPDPHPARASLE
jgi:glycosyltransferase involved in cell wall biosynthesis